MFNIQLSLVLTMALIAFLGLSSAIPSTPGYIGVYQFVAVMLLTKYGYSQGSVVAYITAIQFITIIQVFFWGGIGIIRYYKKSTQVNE